MRTTPSHGGRYSWTRWEAQRSRALARACLLTAALSLAVVTPAVSQEPQDLAATPHAERPRATGGERASLPQGVVFRRYLVGAAGMKVSDPIYATMTPQLARSQPHAAGAAALAVNNASDANGRGRRGPSKTALFWLAFGFVGGTYLAVDGSRYQCESADDGTRRQGKCWSEMLSGASILTTTSWTLTWMLSKAGTSGTTISPCRDAGPHPRLDMDETQAAMGYIEFIRRGGYAALPPAQAIGWNCEGATTLVVENQTPYTLQVYVSGPMGRVESVSAQSTKTLRLLRGRYEMGVRADHSEVPPLYGVQELRQGVAHAQTITTKQK